LKNFYQITLEQRMSIHFIAKDKLIPYMLKDNPSSSSVSKVSQYSSMQPVRSAYQPPASSTFLSERISHQQPAATSQQYSSLRTNQHQPSATSQPNRPMNAKHECGEN
jgi:hypothetical protein